jgi:hypothetical protein
MPPVFLLLVCFWDRISPTNFCLDWPHFEILSSWNYRCASPCPAWTWLLARETSQEKAVNLSSFPDSPEKSRDVNFSITGAKTPSDNEGERDYSPFCVTPVRW